MADARLFAKLDLGYFDNPKIADFIEDHPHAIFLHLRAILYCRQHLTDGHFPVRIVCRMASATYCGSECESECDYCRATAAGLFERVDAKTGNVHDYLDHQDSAEQVQNRSRAGRKGAHSRWSEARDADRNADRNADTNAEERRGEESKEKTLAPASTKTKVGQVSRTAPRKARGARIPEDFALTPDMREWAHRSGMSHLDIDGITDNFRDYWTAETGAKATKLDWIATWRTWVRREAERRKPRTREMEPSTAWDRSEIVRAPEPRRDAS